jgi:hypothetical protein
MKTKFICLANSYKEGGRCVAGIELDANNNPIITGGRPKWIRPVTGAEHGVIPTVMAESFKVLDIIEIDITDLRPEGYQSENVTFNESNIRVNNKCDKDRLHHLCENKNLIFGSTGKAVSKENIENLNHSLMLIQVNRFEIVLKEYEDRPGKPQIRLLFNYNGSRYDLPVTDPQFLFSCQKNSELLHGISPIYLCVSLGIEWNGWYYKLIAGIIY